MKTAQTIERQESRKKDEKTPRLSSQFSEPVSEARRRSLANLKPFPKGVSGNPGGVPKYDVAAELARAVIEGNQELIYKAFVKALSKGNAYAFQVLSDRGFGKLRERIEVDRGPYADMSEQDLEQRIRELEAKLGVPHAEPKILPSASDDSDSKPN